MENILESSTEYSIVATKLDGTILVWNAGARLRYHAMVSDRPYPDALHQDDATAELEANTGTQFDPDVTRALLRGHRTPRRSITRPGGYLSPSHG